MKDLVTKEAILAMDRRFMDNADLTEGLEAAAPVIAAGVLYRATNAVVVEWLNEFQSYSEDAAWVVNRIRRIAAQIEKDATFTELVQVGQEIEQHKEQTMEQQDLQNRFSFHPATTDETRNAHGDVRDLCRELADFLNERLPEGREKSTAIYKLEEAMFWANAAIARAGAK